MCVGRGLKGSGEAGALAPCLAGLLVPSIVLLSSLLLPFAAMSMYKSQQP